MPEGHTIHRMAKDHSKWFQGHAVSLSSPQGRFRAGAQQLDGAIFRGAYAHGKHLFYRLDPQDQPTLVIHIHLGLFGKFRKRASQDIEPSPNCRLRMCSDTHVLDLSGPTCPRKLPQNARHSALIRFEKTAARWHSRHV